jgi:hypothetical protein
MPDERTPAGAPAREAAGPALADLQRELYDLITAPEGVAKRLAELGRAPGDLEAIVRSKGQLSAVERVDVYANMYFFRILEVLSDEYAKLVRLVGADAFHNLITDYLLACRPAHPSLREAGARLPAYLARHPLAENRPWLPELARLERLRLELFDGPDAELLTFDAVRALPPETLPELAVRAIPCHAVLRTEYAITSLWRALEAGSDPTKTDETPPDETRANEARSEDRGVHPPHDETRSVPADPPPIPEAILIWRQELTVFHRVLDSDEAAFLSLLQQGATFATMCENLAEGAAAQAAAQRAFELLARWLADGILQRISPDSLSAKPASP